MVNASRGASAWLYRFHSQIPSMMGSGIIICAAIDATYVACSSRSSRSVRDESPEGHRAIATKISHGRDRGGKRIFVRPCSALYSSQALKEEIMAQRAKLFNALSSSEKECWETIAADPSCEHACDNKQDVQHSVDAIDLLISRAQAERVESELMQRVSSKFRCTQCTGFGFVGLRMLSLSVRPASAARAGSGRMLGRGRPPCTGTVRSLTAPACDSSCV